MSAAASGPLSHARSPDTPLPVRQPAVATPVAWCSWRQRAAGCCVCSATPSSFTVVAPLFDARSAVHFFASADKAKRVLGWQPQHNFMKDVAQVLREGRGWGPHAEPCWMLGQPCSGSMVTSRLPPLPLQLVAEFQASGRLDKEADFSVDDKVGCAVARGRATGQVLAG